MCIGIPGKIIEIKGSRAKIEQGEHFHWVDISSLEERVKKGDYLLTYQKAAVNKISAKEAKEVLELMDGAGNTGVKGAD
jgi:hydrogenase assembly chaperone HypC/HupF